MILKRLVEFEERRSEGANAERPLPSGYQSVLINKMIRLTDDGHLRDVITLSGDKKGSREGKFMPVPVASPPRSSNVKAYLIADKAMYVFGIPKSKQRKDRERAGKCREDYVALVNACAKATSVSEVAALAQWLKSDYREAVRQIRSPDEYINFQVGDTVLTDISAVREFAATQGQEGKGDQRCLVTGTLSAIESRMPFKIKDIPGGRPSGTALVSMNRPAFESYGLQAALNSPISREAAEAFHNALNYMVSSRKHHLRLEPKTIYLFWTREDQDFNPLSFLDQPNPEEVRELLRSPERGAERKTAGADDFYALCLTGNSGRAAVRDYLETTIPTVKEALKRWFARQQIVDWETGELKQFGVYPLADSLYLKSDKEMPPGPPAALLRSALTAAPLPQSLLALAVKRNIAEQGPQRTWKGKKNFDLARLALIKATYLSNGPKKEENTLRELEPNRTDSGYMCGRLLAVIESIQRAATPGIKATLVDRYYGSASTTPASVFGNLMRMAQPHLSKLRKTNERAFYALQERLESVLTGLQGFPYTLTLQQQALFALGYYHQKAKDRADMRAHKELKDLAEALDTETVEREEN